MNNLIKFISIVMLIFIFFTNVSFAITDDTEDKKSEDIFFEDFNDKLDSSKWLVANKAWGGYNNGVVPENITIDNGIARFLEMVIIIQVTSKDTILM